MAHSDDSEAASANNDAASSSESAATGENAAVEAEEAKSIKCNEYVVFVLALDSIQHVHHFLFF